MNEIQTWAIFYHETYVDILIQHAPFTYGRSDRRGSMIAQSPPQSKPPFFGSQPSFGTSRHTWPAGHGKPAMPPQNLGPTQMPGQSAAIKQFLTNGLSMQAWPFSGHWMPSRPAQMGFLLGVGVGGAVVLVLVGVGHFCIKICTLRLGLDGAGRKWIDSKKKMGIELTVVFGLPPHFFAQRTAAPFRHLHSWWTRSWWLAVRTDPGNRRCLTAGCSLGHLTKGHSHGLG